MSMIRYAMEGNFGRFWGRLQTVAKKSGRNTLALAADFGMCLARYGCGFSDYINYRWWELSGAERKEYVTIRDTDKFYEKVSPSAYKTFFTVKPNFLQNFAQYVGRTFFDPSKGSFEEMEAFLQGKAGVMVKTVDGLCGLDVHRQMVADIGDHAAFYAQLKEKRLFLEELIQQHSEMSELYAGSVNTIRVMTVAAGGKSEILFASLRVGCGGDVDNFHAGGMSTAVDVETGKLLGPCVNKVGDLFDKHPQTGVVFTGRQLPNWDIVRKICLEGALVNQKIHVVGWDVAITQDGAVFVEGNRRPAFDLPQMTLHRGCRDIIRRAEAFIAAAGEGTN